MVPNDHGKAVKQTVQARVCALVCCAQQTNRHDMAHQRHIWVYPQVKVVMRSNSNKLLDSRMPAPPFSWQTMANLMKCDAGWHSVAIFSRSDQPATNLAELPEPLPPLMGTVSPIAKALEPWPLKENCGVRLNTKVKHCQALDLIVFVSVNCLVRQCATVMMVLDGALNLVLLALRLDQSLWMFMVLYLSWVVLVRRSAISVVVGGGR